MSRISRYRGTLENKPCVYILRDPRDGSVFYIGSTSKPRSRFNQHCSAAHLSGRHESPVTQRLIDLNQSGLRPIMEQIEFCDPDDLALYEESLGFFLKGNGASLINLNFGFTPVALGRKYSKAFCEMRRKIQKQRMKNKRVRIAALTNLKRPSLESRKKISQTMKIIWSERNR